MPQNPILIIKVPILVFVEPLRLSLEEARKEWLIDRLVELSVFGLRFRGGVVGMVGLGMVLNVCIGFSLFSIRLVGFLLFLQHGRFGLSVYGFVLVFRGWGLGFVWALLESLQEALRTDPGSGWGCFGFNLGFRCFRCCF